MSTVTPRQTPSPAASPSASLGPLAERTFAAVIFDMDGTLVDSTPAVERSWSTWAAEYEITAEQMANQHGKPAASLVRLLLAEDRHAAAIERINALELADTDGVVVLPGAAEALAALTEAPNAIATSCTRPLAQVQIAAASLAAPSTLVTADDVEHGKPAPDPFLLAAQRLGVDPADCLVVEDAPAGITAAQAAGCHTLAVVTTNRPEDLHADAVVGTLADVEFSVVDGRIRIALAH